MLFYSGDQLWRNKEQEFGKGSFDEFGIIVWQDHNAYVQLFFFIWFNPTDI